MAKDEELMENITYEWRTAPLEGIGYVNEHYRVDPFQSGYSKASGAASIHAGRQS